MSVVSVAAGGRTRLDVTLNARSVSTRDRYVDRSHAVAMVATATLLLVAPFERLEPLVRLPGQSLSSVESVLLAGLGAWIAARAWKMGLPRWQTVLTAPWLLWLAVALSASVISPISVGNAAHMTARFALAFLVFLLARAATSTPRGRIVTLAALTVSAVAASTLVGLEFLGVPAVLDRLQAFRSSVAVVGGAVRAGGPFQYPTIASMYLEIAFAGALGLLVEALERHWSVAVACVLALAIISEGIVLTFTRAGLITTLVTIAIVGILRVRERGWDRAAWAVMLVAVVFIAQIAATRSLELLRLRLTTEGQEAWFRASFAAPATLALRTGERVRVPLSITNTGGLAWDSVADTPVHLSYHWLDANTDRVIVWEGERTLFARPVRSGSTVGLDATVQAPPAPGAYRLVWDLEQVNRLWFSTEPGAKLAMTSAEVTGPVLGMPSRPRVAFMPRAAERPGRLVLWRAAWAMTKTRPLLGVGPDNFRLHYGDAAAIKSADPRVHSNSMYVEVLAGTGLVGASAFAWLMWRVRQVASQALTTAAPMASGLVAAVAAIAVHGLIDTFLGFTATYVLIAVVLGLITSVAEGSEPHAHRI